MKEMFQELYNKVLSLFNSSKEDIDPTKNIALNRLKTVLMQDRVGFSERSVQILKEELVVAISKYVEINPDEFNFEIDATKDGASLLNLSVPIIKAKTDDEIDAAFKEQELKIQKKAQEIVKELEALIKERAEKLTEGEIDPALIEEAAKKISNNKEEKEAAPDEAEAENADKTNDSTPQEKNKSEEKDKDKTMA